MESSQKGIEEIVGVVIHGDKRGKQLGFPTANVRVHAQSSDGVYISIAYIHNTWRPALTFIGAPKTFQAAKRRIETYILDFNEDIYGIVLPVRLLQQLRNNEKFSTVEALIAAMKSDEEKARQYFELT